MGQAAHVSRFLLHLLPQVQQELRKPPSLLLFQQSRPRKCVDLVLKMGVEGKAGALLLVYEGVYLLPELLEGFWCEGFIILVVGFAFLEAHFIIYSARLKKTNHNAYLFH